MQPGWFFLFLIRIGLGCIIFLFPYRGFGQSGNAVITGKVADATRVPVPFASVVLLRFQDSVSVKSTTCNNEGTYQLVAIPPGKYWLNISAIGYRTPAPITIEVEGGQTYQHHFSISKEEKALEEVKVVSRKPPIQIKADRTILNVAASINASGYNAFELLAKAPGVRIMNNEDILVNGKSGLAVYLDGKLLQIQGQEIIDFLQSLPAANIEQIEIITHPSARYDAAGSAGVINIRTKKSLAVGFNGTATLLGIVTPFKPKIEGSTTLNYRQKKYNAYGTYSYTGGNYRNLLEDSRAQDLTGIGNINFSQHYRGVFSRKINNYRTGIDYFLSKNSTLGFVVNASNTNWLYDRNSLTDIFRTTTRIDSQLVSKTVQPKTYKTQNYNLTYLYHDSTGRDLTIDATYGWYNTFANTDQTNNYVNGAVLLRSNANTNTNDAAITIAAIKADYAQKLWKGNISTGIKASKVKSDNDLLFFNVVNNTLKPDTGRTNHFVYKEEIVAGYFDYSFTLSKFDFQMGLRLEHTRSTGNLTTITRYSGQAVDTAYLNLFPNLVMNYKVNEKHNLGLALSRRINRPAYQILNPFEFVLDELSYTKGNPFLKPKTSYDIKLSHSYKGIITTALNYTHTQNYFLNYRDTLAGGKTFSTTINAGTQQYFTVNSSLQISPTKWWDVFVYAEAFYQSVNGKVNQLVLKQGQLSAEASGSNTFRIGKLWSAEVSGYWNSRYFDAPANVHAQWSVDAGLQRKILKEAGTVRFNATDLFGSLKFSLNRNYGGLYYRMANRWESRQYRLSFTYKFGNNNIKASKSRKSGVAEEQGRLG